MAVLPVVEVLLAVALPVVPTAPAVFELPIRQPVSVISGVSLRAVWLARVARVRRVERAERGEVVVCVPVAPEVSPVAGVEPCEVTSPRGVAPRCELVLLCAPSAAVQPIISATTAESPARFILFLLSVV